MRWEGMNAFYRTLATGHWPLRTAPLPPALTPVCCRPFHDGTPSSCPFRGLPSTLIVPEFGRKRQRDKGKAEGGRGRGKGGGEGGRGKGEGVGSG